MRDTGDGGGGFSQYGVDAFSGASASDMLCELVHAAFNGIGVRYFSCRTGWPDNFTCWFADGTPCPVCKAAEIASSCRKAHLQWAQRIQQRAENPLFACMHGLRFVASPVRVSRGTVGVVQSSVFRLMSSSSERAGQLTAFRFVPALDANQQAGLVNLIGLLTELYPSVDLDHDSADCRPHVDQVMQVVDSLRNTDNLYGICLVSLSARLAMSPSRLSHMVHEYTGFTFSEHLCRARLSLARRLLADRGLHICEIAHRCGYDTPSAFTVFFTHCQGVSPSVYREGAC